MYDLLLSVHLIAAVVWVGGSVALAVLSGRMSRAERVAAIPQFSWYGGRVLPAAAVVLLIAGFGLVSEIDASLGDPWISIAFAIWIISAILGSVFIARAGREVETAAAAGGDPAAADRAFGRLLTLIRIDTALVLLAVVDMAVKPGA